MQKINPNSGDFLNPVDKAICNSKLHLSILLIKTKFESQEFFFFFSNQNLTCRKKFKMLISKEYLLNILPLIKF